MGCKKHDLLFTFDAKKSVHIIIVAKYEFSGNCEIQGKWMQTRVPKQPKSITLAASGQIFEISERFRKMRIVDDF